MPYLKINQTMILRKTGNRKVKNATPTEIDGIRFRSKREASVYQRLKDEGIPAEYEQHRYDLLSKFTFQEENIRAITYKPDFVGKNFVIEVKGFGNDGWKLREKLFKKWLSENQPDTKFYVVYNNKDIDNTITEIKQNINKLKIITNEEERQTAQAA